MRSIAALARFVLAGALLLGPAATQARAETGPAVTTRIAESPRPTASPATLDALEREEDEGLATHRASGGWAWWEILIVVLLLVFLFPIGLIVLIILLIVKD
jgi:hypothetical protein